LDTEQAMTKNRTIGYTGADFDAQAWARRAEYESQATGGPGRDFLIRPGPQPHNQIAATSRVQLRPRQRTPRDPRRHLLRLVRREMRRLLLNEVPELVAYLVQRELATREGRAS
jgi:hypothetical protein